MPTSSSQESEKERNYEQDEPSACGAGLPAAQRSPRGQQAAGQGDVNSSYIIKSKNIGDRKKSENVQRGKKKTKIKLCNNNKIPNLIRKTEEEEEIGAESV